MPLKLHFWVGCGVGDQRNSISLENILITMIDMPFQFRQ